MIAATLTETRIGSSGVIMLHDAKTGNRLRAAIYGLRFECTRDEAIALVTDYAQRKGIHIVETVTQTEEATND